MIAEIRDRLKRHGFDVALRHLDQAEAAFAAENWEAANSQVRTFLEALFNAVAAIRLGAKVTGGAARKGLQEEGLLNEREGKFLQAFMEWAGEHGSHAGMSSADQTSSRRLVALGIALLGLSLIPDVVRVNDVLANSWKASGRRPPKDTEIITSCPTCGDSQTLGEAEVRRDGMETVYHCRNGCQAIVVVGLPGDSPWPGRGYRLGRT